MATIAEELAAMTVVDTFNRSQDPLAGEWALMKPGITKGKCITTSGTGWTAKSTLATGPDAAYWTKAKFKASSTKGVASLVRITHIPSNTSLRQGGVWIFRNPTTPETVQSGYHLRFEYKGANKIKFTLEKWVTGEVSVLAELETTEFKVGSRIAIVFAKGKLMMFASVEAASEFKEKLSVEDSTYEEGYGGVYGIGATEFVVRDFATGEFNLEVPEAPAAVTSAASGVTYSDAQLNGTVDPNLAATTYYFEYGTTTSYGTKVPAEEGSAGSGSTPQAVSQNIAGLAPSTVYHFRVVAKNEKGESKGSDQTFETDAAPAAGMVKIKVGGSLVEAKRWIKTPSGLVNI